MEQEQKCAVVLRQVGERDVLAIAGIVCEAKRAVVEDFDEPLGTAAMLNVRRART
jgi:hypothetical protein